LKRAVANEKETKMDGRDGLFAGLLMSVVFLGACVPDVYRAVPPVGMPEHDQRRVTAYCARYSDPEPCYLAAGYILEPVRKPDTRTARVDWQTTF
jgi:hypothetical protein